jgi:hypothetical protein
LGDEHHTHTICPACAEILLDDEVSGSWGDPPKRTPEESPSAGSTPDGGNAIHFDLVWLGFGAANPPTRC